MASCDCPQCRKKAWFEYLDYLDRPPGPIATILLLWWMAVVAVAVVVWWW